MESIKNALLWVMRQIGYAICHQIPSRCLEFDGRTLPVCARDTGIYLSFFFCMLAFLIIYRGKAPKHPSRKKLLIVALMIVPTVVDAITSYAGLRESTNLVRLLTGVLAGASISALVFPFMKGYSWEEKAGDREEKTMFERWGILVLFAAPPLFSLLLLLNWPGAFWFWAPIVTLSIFATIYSLCYALFHLLLDFLGGRRVGFFSGLTIPFILATAVLLLSNVLHHLAENAL
ncbi:MAG: DUF2085 domain-containing protein [Actinomycetota bacterium]|nr:DUF2085 domain-containing protein [Actinomycetota bacterium]